VQTHAYVDTPYGFASGFLDQPGLRIFSRNGSPRIMSLSAQTES
jgi:hypothetical protein